MTASKPSYLDDVARDDLQVITVFACKIPIGLHSLSVIIGSQLPVCRPQLTGRPSAYQTTKSVMGGVTPS